jgi:hypothetical protein
MEAVGIIAEGASVLAKWKAAFKSGLMSSSGSTGCPPDGPVHVMNVLDQLRWEKKEMSLRLVLSGHCCNVSREGTCALNGTAGVIHCTIPFAKLDAASDMGTSAVKAAIKSALLKHFQSSAAGAGKDAAECKLCFDAERDCPTWALDLLVQKYAAKRDDASATASRKLLRDGSRKIDRDRSWLKAPEPTTSRNYYYTNEGPSRTKLSRDYENFQQFLYKMCKESMPKVKRLFQKFARQHEWDCEALMSFEVRDKVRRSLAMTARARDCIGTLRAVGSRSTEITNTLGVIVSSLCPSRHGLADGEMNGYLKDLGIKGTTKLKWVYAAVDQRWAFDVYDKGLGDLSPVIAVGEPVECRGGAGQLVNRCDVTGKVTVHMNDTNQPSSWDSEGRAGARLRRCPPSLFPARAINPDSRSLAHQAREAVMQEFLIRANVQSPNKKDKVIKTIGYNTKDEKLIIWRMVPWDTLWTEFKAEPAHRDVVDHFSVNGVAPARAPPSFISSGPWWMRKGKDQACLCLICEELACKYRAQCLAVRRLLQIAKEAESNVHHGGDAEFLASVEAVRNVLSQTTKMEMCKQVLKPCLEDSDLASARGCCERGECGACGFSVVWAKLRSKIVHLKPVDVENPVEGENCEDYREDVNPLWMNKMLWQGYVKRPRPVAGGTLTAADDEEYVASVKTARDAVLQTSQGSLVEFLDAMDHCLKKHVPHRVLQSQVYIAQRDLARNRRPKHGVYKNMDFSENPGPKNARLLQADHWTSLNFTLFISIYDWVIAKEWNRTEGVLPVGAEVTVKGEFAGADVNLSSYWGVIDDGNGAEPFAMVLAN